MSKYNEDKYLKELGEYIDNTYKGHYVGTNNIQALDLIFAAGHGHGFCIGNILKYAPRYGKKKGFNRDDLMKTLHYAILMLHVHDIDHADSEETEPRVFKPAPRVPPPEAEPRVFKPALTTPVPSPVFVTIDVPPPTSSATVVTNKRPPTPVPGFK